MEEGSSCDTEFVNVTNKKNNTRGLHKPLKQKSVHHLIHSRKIDIACILESKFNEKSLLDMMRIHFPGMKFFHNFSLSNKGRILILWNPLTVHLNMVSMSVQSMHVTVDNVPNVGKICLSFVYGLNTIVLRRNLWEDLKLFGETCSLPWITLGDFNSVLTQSEKKGGLPITDYNIKDFVDCVSSLDLIDLRYIGCKFTWYSPKVCSKLDHVLVNQKWISSSLDGLAEFVAPGCISDHTVSIVSFLHHNLQRQKPFKFFNMWALSDRFMDIVRDNWNFLGYGTKQFILKEKFKNVKKPLQLLNKNQFGHISSRANCAKKRLQSIQEEMLSSGVIPVDYGDSKRNTELLLEAERLFIAQKSKISYIHQGDRLIGLM
ncbi:uncharacterized protein [Primulina eburnea]|uniref:uncharacterized protein n=1 Tax=Primulina eburnea TaxID=1245227 RepID=UPI003C6C5971